MKTVRGHERKIGLFTGDKMAKQIALNDIARETKPILEYIRVKGKTIVDSYEVGHVHLTLSPSKFKKCLPVIETIQIK